MLLYTLLASDENLQSFRNFLSRPMEVIVSPDFLYYPKVALLTMGLVCSLSLHHQALQNDAILTGYCPCLPRFKPEIIDLNAFCLNPHINASQIMVLRTGNP